MSTRPRPSVKLVVKLLAVFVLLNLADLFLTWKLMHASGGQVIESNPVAAWWLAAYGWAGMTAFKLGMLLVVGSLVGGIACLRPRAGELLLVFGCGAQSAVVLDSVFLTRLVDERAVNAAADMAWLASAVPGPEPASPSPRSFRPGFLPEDGPLVWLTQESIQNELRLSDTQVQRIVQLAGKRREVRMGSHRLSRSEWDARVRELLAEEKSLTDDLRPEQAVRLQQIAWQQRGPFAFTDPEVGEALQLTVEQLETVHAIVEEAKKARAMPPRGWGHGSDVGRRADGESSGNSSRLWTVLTSDQLAKWKEMTGEPFQGELRPRPGTTPGAGRDAWRPRRPPGSGWPG
jgi:hypothetical protein